MRLGVVGLCGDFRTLTSDEIEKIKALEFTGLSFHFRSAEIPTVPPDACSRCVRMLEDANFDLVQFGITYEECLFHPDAAVREAAIASVQRGMATAASLNAHHYLFRPGSLNPDGAWTSHRDNHLPESMERLIETLKPIAAHAEQHELTLVMETHAVSIMGSPEICREVVERVGSDRLRIVMDFVNHFQTLLQVYNSEERLNHIFDVMGPVAPMAHIKDISVQNGLVLHLNEEVPGEGELELGVALKRFDELYPDGYGLIEHLPAEKIPLANANVRRIATENGVRIH
ncbi:sugar phosphate isomerase/epimerase [Candidatus Poribacteria bacterium]|nr:sugar phosphate isomerase/epimerase [Candidatus Poribacteria bacterium]MYK19854.1 sugar phosphate isomerase/epimerase [Candidatus Poribacteria bacterium]